MVIKTVVYLINYQVVIIKEILNFILFLVVKLKNHINLLYVQLDVLIKTKILIKFINLEKQVLHN